MILFQENVRTDGWKEERTDGWKEERTNGQTLRNMILAATSGSPKNTLFSLLENSLLREKICKNCESRWHPAEEFQEFLLGMGAITALTDYFFSGVL